MFFQVQNGTVKAKQSHAQCGQEEGLCMNSVVNKTYNLSEEETTNSALELTTVLAILLSLLTRLLPATLDMELEVRTSFSC